MIKKTVTYTDFNGVERTEDFFFHLSQAEVAEMQLSVNGGYAEMLQKIIGAKDTPSLIKIFKELLLKAYGEVSDDGRRFIKSEELSEAFSQTEAYSQIFMELAANDVAAAEFCKGIMPVVKQNYTVAPKAALTD